MLDADIGRPERVSQSNRRSGRSAEGRISALWRNLISKQDEKARRAHYSFKVEKGLEWGLEFLGLDPHAPNPVELVRQFTEEKTRKSKEFFTPPRLPQSAYSLRDDVLTFPSPLKSTHVNSDTVFCRYFPKKSRKAVIVIPHWNAAGKSLDKLCRALNAFGFSSVRLSLPYHDNRMPDGHKVAYDMVSSNIGLTIHSMRQSVLETLLLVDWLENVGHERIGIMGSSIGSCTAFLAASHDPRLNAVVNNLMSSYFGEVVWTGVSTGHIRKGLEGHLSLDEIRDLWMLNSPINFVNKVPLYNPGLKNLVISAKYDTTYLPYLTDLIMEEYGRFDIDCRHVTLPCGHYTLGKGIFKYIDAYLIITFFLRSL